MRIGTGFLVSMAFQVSHVHMYSVYDICIQIKKFKKQQKYVIPWKDRGENLQFFTLAKY